MGTLLVKGQSCFPKVMQNAISTLIKYIKDPSNILNERQTLKKRTTILKECVKIIQNIWAIKKLQNIISEILDNFKNKKINW